MKRRNRFLNHINTNAKKGTKLLKKNGKKNEETEEGNVMQLKIGCAMVGAFFVTQRYIKKIQKRR